jgi:eukaryotic-like serine/threonine-protein kinase
VPVLDRFKHALGERYRIERLIGSGGMADVYLAEDRKHHRKVAIKLFKPDLSTRLGPDRFLREIDIAAKLTHPNILPLHDSGSADGLLFFVMPYIEGESLRRRLSRDGPMPVSDVIRIVREIVDGLTYAHSQGVVHRDIKPDNVLMAGRHALVADFGVAKAVSDVTVDQEVTSFGAVIGTPSYMAPEQAAAAGIDHRADIYAVGALAYELLTGRSPFQWNVSRQTTVEPAAVESLAVHRPDVPAALDALVMRCLAKSRDERWQTGAELLAALEAMSDTATPTPLPQPGIANKTARRAYVLVGISAALVIVAAAWMSGVFAPRKGEAWLRGSAIPTIRQLTDDGDFIAAHMLAMEANTVHPDDAALTAEWDRFTARVGIASDPPGAQVYVRQNDAAQEWHPLGETPLENIRFPRGGAYRVRFEKAGYRTYEGMVTAGWLIPGFTFPLNASGSIADDLVRVPGGTISVESPGGERLPALQLNDFLIDRYEVTNRRFKAFVDAGGYTRREFWREPFVKQGRVQSWEDAMRTFVDQTGRPGPAQWELSAYPKGQDEEPVRGVSWYEAAAYAAFEGRDLPTIYHWNRAAGIAAASWIVAASNFSDTGPVRVGTAAGISRFGVADMAGNVREWCINQSLQGTEGRFILGGGWNDAAYMFTDLYAQSPWDRSPSNGLRLVTYRDTGDALERSKRAVTTDVRDFRKEKPVDDREYDVYRRMYAYDRTPLNAAVERTDTTDDWIRHRVSFDAAYGGERASAYLYLPRKVRPPYQTVVYFPGSGAIFQRSIDADFSAAWDFLVKGGRAVMFPIYRGTFGRQTELNSDLPNETVAYRDYVVQWAKDLGRSIDYLETRTDIDAGKTAYFGFSWGGRLGGLLLAVEPRLKVGVLHVAGLKFQRALPEADPVNFVRRITIPVLMLNGKYDQFFPLETSQIPLFQMLGTPPEHKRHVVYEAGHFVPRPQLAKETLDWLDRYLGPIPVASGDDASR